MGSSLFGEVTRPNTDLEHVGNIIDVGCPIDRMDEMGRAALYWAAQYGKLDLVKLLISKGADIHARDNYGCTIHDIATMNYRINIQRFLDYRMIFSNFAFIRCMTYIWNLLKYGKHISNWPPVD